MIRSIERSEKVVILADRLAGCSTSALHRAVALAREHGAVLHILQAHPSFDPIAVTAAVAREAAASHLAAIDKALGWAAREVPCDVTWVLHYVEKALDAAVIDHASSHRVEIVVLAPSVGQSGELVHRIATRSGVPVLVAREPVLGPTLIATDLQDPSYPVLQCADTILGPTRAPIALHVVKSAVDLPAEPRLHRVHSAAAMLNQPTHAVLASGPSIAKTIVREARTRRAAVIVVGARVHSRGRAGEPEICKEIVRRSWSSVLVVPLPRRDSWSPYARHGAF